MFSYLRTTPTWWALSGVWAVSTIGVPWLLRLVR